MDHEKSAYGKLKNLDFENYISRKRVKIIKFPSAKQFKSTLLIYRPILKEIEEMTRPKFVDLAWIDPILPFKASNKRNAVTFVDIMCLFKSAAPGAQIYNCMNAFFSVQFFHLNYSLPFLIKCHFLNQLYHRFWCAFWNDSHMFI